MSMTDEHWLPYESEADKLPLDTACGDELERADSDDKDHHVTVWGSWCGQCRRLPGCNGHVVVIDSL
jgi:hypothetical protein